MCIVLVRPPFVPTGFDQQFQEPLNLCYLAAVLRRDGHEVHMLDAEFDELDTPAMLRAVADDRPEVVGISLMSAGGLAETLHLVSGVRQWAAPRAHIVVGGQFATFYAEYLARMAPEIDSIVLFEGENVIGPLVRAVLGGEDWRTTRGIAVPDGTAGRLRRTPAAPPIADLDALPLPSRDLLPKAMQLGLSPSVLSSRGCAGQCSFCTIHGFMRTSSGMAWRGRSPESVVHEIAALADAFRVGEIGFLDDDFIGTRTAGWARASAIADLLLARRLDVIYNIECRPDMIGRDLFAKLRDSGLRSVFVGVEGVTEAAIRTFHKGVSKARVCGALDTLSDLGLEFDVGYILYHPYCTLPEVWEGYQFLKSYGQCDVHTVLNRMFVAPGAPIHERLVSEGRLSGPDRSSPRSNEYEFLDRRVAVLLAILRVAVFPVFPCWYAAIKEYRKLRAETKFSDDPLAAAARMTRLKSFTRGIDRVVEDCFEDAFRFAAQQPSYDGDMLVFARRLKDEVLSRAGALAQSNSCDECLSQTQ